MDPTRIDELIAVYRDGRLSVSLKGNLWKGPFHLPRMQLVCWKLLQEMKRKCQQPESAG
jgi:N-acylglucosamine 2-epimerase